MGNKLVELSEEQFDKAYEAEKKENEERKSSFFSNEMADIRYSALETDRYRFIRILGVPIHIRHLDPKYSPKIVKISWIKADNNKSRFRCIWPAREDDSDFILYKVMDKVLQYEYNPAKNSREYFYEDQCPDIFQRVFKNNLPKNSKNYTLEKGWKDTTYVVMNVIDREFDKWHKENKHSLLLSKKKRVKTNSEGEEIEIFDPGVPYMVYDSIRSDDVAGTFGNFQNYDVIIKKMNKDPWYKIYHPTQEQQIMGRTKKDEFLKEYPFYDPKVHNSPLTEEEREYERYDIDKYFPVTSNTKIYNNLGSFIKTVDNEFGTKFYEELQQKVEQEKKLRNEEEQENKSEYIEDSSFANTDDSEEEPEEEPEEETTKEIVKEQEQPKRERASRSQTQNDFDLSAYEKDYPTLKELSEEEREAIIGYDEEAEVFLYKEDAGEILLCTDDNDIGCKMESPESFTMCPGCGIKF